MTHDGPCPTCGQSRPQCLCPECRAAMVALIVERWGTGFWHLIEQNPVPEAVKAAWRALGRPDSEEAARAALPAPPQEAPLS